VGHSLGAGTAAILCILLRREFPATTCFSFSPPGGLLRYRGGRREKEIRKGRKGGEKEEDRKGRTKDIKKERRSKRQK
jgi:hypothetical protein